MRTKILRPATRAMELVLFILLLQLSTSSLLAAPSGKVNINTADAEELTLLPRIGPAVAGRILEFRDENGPFKGPEELMLVRGIGEKTYQLIEPWITIEGETTLREKVRSAGAAGDESG